MFVSRRFRWKPIPSGFLADVDSNAYGQTQRSTIASHGRDGFSDRGEQAGADAVVAYNAAIAYDLHLAHSTHCQLFSRP
ncbi:MAG: hypothetical protein P8N76_24015 [Pirellulaceae bacterium]|nr:hypothetical protein [Pirellulaceae bacterium]